MEIGLSPREIQSRIRAGASTDEVAEAAGVSPERIEGFAAPVLAEREHVAALALAAAVRRRGDPATHRTLNVAVTDRLAGRGVRAEQISWDAWRREDRRWTLVARYELGAAPREAVFHYHQQNRFSVPANDDARWLTGELTALPGAPDDPTEPTVDLNDELALVRALREPDSDDRARLPGDPEPAPVAMLHGPTAGADEPDAEADPADLGPQTAPPSQNDVPLPRSQATPQDIGQEIEAQLSSYGNGQEPSGLDMLYDFFDSSAAGENYAGLSPAEAAAEQPVEPEQPPLDFGDEPRVDDTPVTETPDTHAAPQPAGTPRRQRAAPGPRREAAPERDEAAEETVRTPRSRGGRRRASVPSWDEIMFGGPKKE